MEFPRRKQRTPDDVLADRDEHSAHELVVSGG